MKDGLLPGYIFDDLALARMAALLNGDRHGRERLDTAGSRELHDLVAQWLACKADWQRFLTRMLRAGKPVPFTQGTFHVPSNLRKPVMVPFPAPGSTEAQGVFLQFVLHPEHWRLRGPCRRPGCGRYFLKKTARPQDYCSPRCAARASAKRTLKASREARHRKLVELATAAIAAYKPQRGDWKAWVVSYVHRQGEAVTSKALTRWVNTGELQAPETVSKRRQV